ncbi:MAG: sigE [Nocardioides sp.]|nr:sigE [Nocardioides sp.]
MLLGCSLQEAEDLTQTTLARCFTSWSKVQAARHRDAYVAKVLINVHRQSRRRRWWDEKPADHLPEQGQADMTAHVAGVDAVHRALGDLTPGQREVVVLRFYAQLSEQETAEALGVAVGTVKSRMSRALELLTNNSHLVDLRDGGNS